VKFCNSTGEILREELPPQRSRQGWTHQAQLREEEHIYGLGERAAPLNLRAAREVTEKGDIECTWGVMRQTVATVVGLGLSGIPYSGPDIGGFQGNPPALGCG
jgi:alpha-glucosidase (family GH31 glycosyl hydrolase)